jgi:hypothetical protein
MAGHGYARHGLNKRRQKMEDNTIGMIIVTLFLVAYVLLSLWSARRRREMEALAAMDNGLSEASFRAIMHTMMREPDDETTDIAIAREVQ